MPSSQVPAAHRCGCCASNVSGQVQRNNSLSLHLIKTTPPPSPDINLRLFFRVLSYLLLMLRHSTTMRNTFHFGLFNWPHFDNACFLRRAPHSSLSPSTEENTRVLRPKWRWKNHEFQNEHLSQHLVSILSSNHTISLASCTSSCWLPDQHTISHVPSFLWDFAVWRAAGPDVWNNKNPKPGWVHLILVSRDVLLEKRTWKPTKPDRIELAL